MAKILAVDDERNIARLVQVNLERQGHQVTVAYDGEEALQKVAQEKFDLIVCDVMMPRKDGFQVLNELKANPATAEIPVIMLTAKAQDADVFRGWSSGVDCYLTKPFNPQELVNFVQRVLESQNQVGGDSFDGGAHVWKIG
ncbi:MAG: response regulator [Armatimonadetes bacterium]|jgi:two-component system alkaline phosphatase synthesis response regulator PhoP/two-component system response regulator VicR|nr:response regulator [Armatimonadota bacterium]HOC31016.1 response regulator [Armatimonadota bacterium]